jgi:RNA polymerase sigma-70 factor (ECF subfamily)
VIGRSDPDFEDIVQLSFERVLLSITRKQYAGRCNLATWSSVIASRVAIDHLRRRRHERRVFWFRKEDTDELPEPSTHEKDSPEGLAQRQRVMRALRSALARVSPEKAETVVLFEVLGRDLPEVAELTGVSVAAAQSRLVRGRKEISTHLEKLLGGKDGR